MLIPLHVSCQWHVCTIENEPVYLFVASSPIAVRALASKSLAYRDAQASSFGKFTIWPSSCWANNRHCGQPQMDPSPTPLNFLTNPYPHYRLERLYPYPHNNSPLPFTVCNLGLFVMQQKRSWKVRYLVCTQTAMQVSPLLRLQGQVQGGLCYSWNWTIGIHASFQAALYDCLQFGAE